MKAHHVDVDLSKIHLTVKLCVEEYGPAGTTLSAQINRAETAVRLLFKRLLFYFVKEKTMTVQHKCVRSSSPRFEILSCGVEMLNVVFCLASTIDVDLLNHACLR